jgi:undecaprenyl-diphosphatase
MTAPSALATAAASQHCAGGIDTSFVALGPLKVAFLGVVQGITELLPVSSTAHMRAIPALLGWPDPGSAFSAAMQLAALAAVLAYFRSDLTGLVSGSLGALRRRDWRDHDFRLAMAIVIATIPIAIAGALLSKVLNACHTPLRTPLLIGVACVALAVLLGLAELSARHVRSADRLRLRDAVLIGLAQMGALIPGRTLPASPSCSAFPPSRWPDFTNSGSCTRSAWARMAGSCSPSVSSHRACRPSLPSGA